MSDLLEEYRQLNSKRFEIAERMAQIEAEIAEKGIRISVQKMHVSELIVGDIVIPQGATWFRNNVGKECEVTYIDKRDEENPLQVRSLSTDETDWGTEFIFVRRTQK